LFQSNFEAFTNMAGNNGVTFGVERVVNFKQYQDKNPNMKMLAAHCPTRYPGLPNIKTTAEQGISSPFIWQQIMSAKDMDPQRRKEISDIFTQAERQLGQQEIFKISDQIPPLFYGVSTEQHYNDSWNKLRYYRAKWQDAFRNQ
jgi:tripartite-type tricarboxylate transporter receptor subunit TctC